MTDKPSKKRPIKTAKDITKKSKLAEETLEQSERKYKTLIDTTGNGYVILDSNGNVLDANPEYVRLTGHKSLDEIAGRSVVEWTAPHHRGKNIIEVKKCIEKGFVRNLEIDYIDQTGHITPIEINATLLESNEGHNILTLTRDITERKRAETALREREEKMQSVFRVAPTGIGVVKDRILLDVNPRVCEMTGYSKEELVGKSARIFYPTQEDFEYVGTEKYRQIAERGTGVVESRWMKKDGTIIDVLLASTPIDLKDMSKGVTFTALDITERKKAEEALHESEYFLRTVIDLVPHFIFVKDEQSRFMLVNHALAEAYGTTTHDITGKSDIDFSATPEEAEHFHKDDLEVIRGGVPKVIPEEKITDSTGMQRYLQTVKIPFTFGTNGIPCILGVAIDITERKKAEREIQHRVKELEDFYKITINRKLRMKELKEQMEKLNKELEKYKKPRNP